MMKGKLFWVAVAFVTLAYFGFLCRYAYLESQKETTVSRVEFLEKTILDLAKTIGAEQETDLMMSSNLVMLHGRVVRLEEKVRVLDSRLPVMIPWPNVTLGPGPTIQMVVSNGVVYVEAIE